MSPDCGSPLSSGDCEDDREASSSPEPVFIFLYIEARDREGYTEPVSVEEPAQTSWRVTHVPRMQLTAVLHQDPLEGGQGRPAVGLLARVDGWMVTGRGEWHHP